METHKKNRTISQLIPVLFAFFVMGFVDVVGISTSYVKNDFGLNDKLANLLPMMVFLWFAVCSLPTGLLMGRLGRKKTVLLSSFITGAGMLLPLISYSFPIVLIAFALLGIGNTILQVSLNPLLLDVVSKEKVTGMLTLGQFIKAISSTLGPVIAGIAAGIWGNWQLIFLVYAITTCLSGIWIVITPVSETTQKTNTQTFGDIFSLFKNSRLALAFSVILLIVGFEIGLMTAVPKYLLERCNWPIEQGGLGCSLYFLARTLGTFIGSFLLVRYSSRRFLIGNMIGAFIAFGVFMTTGHLTAMLVSLFLVGLCCANVFPIMFSAAIQSDPPNANNISAMMIMGVSGGAILPLIMGAIADVSSQQASLLVPFAALLYIMYVSVKMKY